MVRRWNYESMVTVYKYDIVNVRLYGWGETCCDTSTNPEITYNN